MRILLPTDAWQPQINGVVRTLSTLVRELEAVGHEVAVIGPEHFPTLPMPGYPEVRLALKPARRLDRLFEELQPDAVHIPVEGPIGFAARRLCLRRGWPFTTSYHTRADLYCQAKLGISSSFAISLQRYFHNAGKGLMVQTDSLEQKLKAVGFKNIRRWCRGVDTDFFRPLAYDEDPYEGLKRPIFVNVGRVSTEKRIEEFLALDLPGTKVVVGDGPQRRDLQERFPKSIFVGMKSGDDLVRHYAAADVFVFPSRFETFGLVALEALACGLPVAAYPVHGPIDVIGNHPVGVLDEDLRAAALRALSIPRNSCRAFAMQFSWRRSAEEFFGNLEPIAGRQMPAAAA